MTSLQTTSKEQQIVNLLLFMSFEKLKAKPAVRVPPNAILLPGSKSMQKCLLLAEGNTSAEGRRRL
jgi:hypothetical protein